MWKIITNLKAGSPAMTKQSTVSKLEGSVLGEEPD